MIEINMNTPVALFGGHIDLPAAAAAPEWTGTMGDFWFENEGAYESFDVFQAALGNEGHIYLGGGAEPEFTLCVQ